MHFEMQLGMAQISHQNQLYSIMFRFHQLHLLRKWKRIQLIAKAPFSGKKATTALKRYVMIKSRDFNSEVLPTWFFSNFFNYRKLKKLF